MSPDLVLLLSVAVYKIAALFIGGFICYLGYRLFIAGVWGNAGDMKATYGDNKLVLKSAAPGTFFAVLGAGVIIVTIAKGMDLQTGQHYTGADAYVAPVERDKFSQRLDLMTQGIEGRGGSVPDIAEPTDYNKTRSGEPSRTTPSEEGATTLPIIRGTSASAGQEG